MPAGCQSSVNGKVTAIYTSVAISPALKAVTTQVVLSNGVVMGLSVAVAWKTHDLKLFPSDDRPTIDPSWHMGLSTESKIGIGVGLGIGLPTLVLLGVCCLFGKGWWKYWKTRKEGKPPTMIYPEAG
jgi:hypothetical protein